MTEKESEFATSRRTLLKAAAVTAVTGGVLTTPATAEQPENSEENRPEGVGTSPMGVGTSPMSVGTSPLTDENIE